MLQIDRIVWFDFDKLSELDFNMAFDKKKVGEKHILSKSIKILFK